MHLSRNTRTQHDNINWFHANVFAETFHCQRPEHVRVIWCCILSEPSKTAFTIKTIFDLVCAPRTTAKQEKHQINIKWIVNVNRMN